MLPRLISKSVGKPLSVAKGSAIDGDVKLIASSPAINTADLPVTPLSKPIEAKNVRMAAGMKGTEAWLQSLALDLFNGRLFAQGGPPTIGTTSPPFDGNVILGKRNWPDPRRRHEVGQRHGWATSRCARTRFTIPELTRSPEISHFAVKDGKLEGRQSGSRSAGHVESRRCPAGESARPSFRRSKEI